jgi:hypothetical protein
MGATAGRAFASHRNIIPSAGTPLRVGRAKPAIVVGDWQRPATWRRSAGGRDAAHGSNAISACVALSANHETGDWKFATAYDMSPALADQVALTATDARITATGQPLCRHRCGRAGSSDPRYGRSFNDVASSGLVGTACAAALPRYNLPSLMPNENSH